MKEQRVIKDKTYIGTLAGIPVRVRAPRKPNKKTIEALTKLVQIVYFKKGNQKDNTV